MRGTYISLLRISSKATDNSKMLKYRLAPALVDSLFIRYHLRINGNRDVSPGPPPSHGYQGNLKGALLR